MEAQAQEDQFMQRLYNPIFQAGLMLVAGIIVTSVAKLVEISNITEVGDRFPWLSAAAFLFMFAIFNSMSSLAVKDDSNSYWGRAIGSFVGLAAVSGLVAYLFSGLSIWEAGSYSWIYVVLAVGYLIFLGMMSFMKAVVQFAQREEWNQPRIKDKGNRRR
ncbi:MAG: hypothetical protein AAGI23_10665 [Bacteroidota bacterium]